MVVVNGDDRRKSSLMHRQAYAISVVCDIYCYLPNVHEYPKMWIHYGESIVRTK